MPFLTLIVVVACRVSHLSLSTPHIRGCIRPHVAGQFVYLNVPEIDPWQWHPFTVSSAAGAVAGGQVRWEHHIKNMDEDKGGPVRDTNPEQVCLTN